MKKLICIILTLGLIASLVACQHEEPPVTQPTPAPVETPAEPGTPEAPPQESTQEPEEATPTLGGRIAVIRNMTLSDHTVQFFAGATSEGEAFGFEVDTFMSEGDDLVMQDLMEMALLQDYDIWIVSHAGAGYQYDMISRAVEQGIKVVAFDSGGDRVQGVTYTSQDDASLASISLDAMIDKAVANGAELPIKVIAVSILGHIVPFDNRQVVVDEYVAQGKIELVDILNMAPGADYFSITHTAVSAALSRYGVGELHGIWAATSFFLQGVIAAVQEADRSDIVLTAIDISDAEIQKLVTVPEYYAIAAVDPYVIGNVMVRLGVSKMLGLPTPPTLEFPAVGITGDLLNPNDTMATLGRYFDNFGSSDMLLTPELLEVRRG